MDDNGASRLREAARPRLEGDVTAQNTASAPDDGAERGRSRLRAGVLLADLAARLEWLRRPAWRRPLALNRGATLAAAENVLPLVVAAGAALFAALSYVRTPEVFRPIFDDAYISLHFARNLAEHAKLTFDGESWSTGATSPFHVAILAALIKLGVAPFTATAAVGVASNVLLALAVYWLGWTIFRTKVAALAGALIVAFMSYVAMDAGNGLETSLFMAMLAASLAAFLSLRTLRGRLLTGGLLALAVLTRPEGMLLLPATALYLLIERNRATPWRETLREGIALYLPPVLVLAGLTLLYLAVTGELTPGTASAKLRFFREFEWPLDRKIAASSHQLGLFIEPLIAQVCLAAVAARRKETSLFVFFLVPFFAMYVLLFPGGLGHYFYRYQHPIMPLLAVLAGGGVAYLLALAWTRDWLVKAVIIGGLVVLAIPIWQQFEVWRGYYEDASLQTRFQLETMAIDLNRIVGEDETLATHDIGAVSYYADYQVLDLVGLVNPEAAEYHSARQLEHYVDAMRPEYVLIFSDWDLWFLHLYAEFRPEQFELVKSYATEPINYKLYRVTYPLVTNR